MYLRGHENISVLTKIHHEFLEVESQKRTYLNQAALISVHKVVVLNSLVTKVEMKFYFLVSNNT